MTPKLVKIGDFQAEGGFAVCEHGHHACWMYQAVGESREGEVVRTDARGPRSGSRSPGTCCQLYILFFATQTSQLASGPPFRKPLGCGLPCIDHPASVSSSVEYG